MPRKIMETGDMMTDIFIFHDGSSKSSGVSIYLGSENKGKKGVAIAKTGPK